MIQQLQQTPPATEQQTSPVTEHDAIEAHDDDGNQMINNETTNTVHQPTTVADLFSRSILVVPIEQSSMDDNLRQRRRLRHQLLRFRRRSGDRVRRGNQARLGGSSGRRNRILRLPDDEDDDENPNQ